ncbi:hypothetical protein DTO027B5_6276 [Paecilomyces variotii]|nr:hypothetical protein DTO169E5_8019 [Paecilomyces variotii]KAJ9268164.1 hypothetical protein DTO212C5_5706 [Paecilomyces variotii]KAJ9322295.1 hypothetical protein DTO027B3_6732 [Paecilomyces variotii]KAJ9331997.1 hypothetical protein DTO027B5_6276 [Paecilomyces variotii]KAJ9403282.1 hypothetical protein DTO045G8_8976 [Paecilomyces variotii]
MGAPSGLLKTLVVPALISLALYLLLSFLIIPFFRRYHQRYSQYLPLQTISVHTSSLRDRLADALMHLFLPSTWRREARLIEGQNDSGSIFDEEGENMVGFDPSRREALERRRSTTSDDQPRLSRDLEEGFMDESDEEDEESRSTSRTRR